LLNRKQF